MQNARDRRRHPYLKTGGDEYEILYRSSQAFSHPSSHTETHNSFVVFEPTNGTCGTLARISWIQQSNDSRFMGILGKHCGQRVRLREKALLFLSNNTTLLAPFPLANSTLLFTTDEQEAVSFWTSLELGEGNAWAHLAEKTTNVHHLHPLKYTFSLHVFGTSLILGFKRGCWKLLLAINNLPTDNPTLLSFQILPYSFTTPSPMWTFTNCKKLIFSTKLFDYNWSLIRLLCLLITLTKFAKVWAVTSVSYGAKTVQYLDTYTLKILYAMPEITHRHQTHPLYAK